MNRVERMHPGVAAHAESPAVGWPVASQRLLLQHLWRRTVATTAARLRCGSNKAAQPQSRGFTDQRPLAADPCGAPGLPGEKKKIHV